MILVDTSAWVEFMRGGRREVGRQVKQLMDADSVAVTEPVRMEVLAGARGEAHARRLAGLMAWAQAMPIEGLADWEVAASLYRACRAGGATPRSQLDCLIAAVAIRENVPVLHADRDFDAIARHTPLRVAPLA